MSKRSYEQTQDYLDNMECFEKIYFSYQLTATGRVPFDGQERLKNERASELVQRFIPASYNAHTACYIERIVVKLSASDNVPELAEFFTCFPRLTYLEIRLYDSFVLPAVVFNLPSLCELKLSFPEHVVFPSITDASSVLTSLTVNGVSQFGTDYHGLTKLTSLRHLHIDAFAYVLVAEIFSAYQSRGTFITKHQDAPELDSLFASLSNLNSLVLGNFKLREIAFPRSLTRLYLHACSYAQFPAGATTLANLQSLSVQDCENFALPSPTSALTALGTLSCENSNATAISPELCALTTLTHLSFYASPTLSAIHPEISRLSRLTCLRISGSSAVSLLPDELFKLTRLKELELSNNIEKLPTTLGNLTNLEILSVPSAKLISFPEEISKLRLLKRIRYSETMKFLPASILQIPNWIEVFFCYTNASRVDTRRKYYRVPERSCAETYFSLFSGDLYKFAYDYVNPPIFILPRQEPPLKIYAVPP